MKNEEEITVWKTINNGWAFACEGYSEDGFRSKVEAYNKGRQKQHELI